MLGFLIGTASLVGLIYVLKHTDHRGGYRCASGHSWLLGKLFRKLDTSAGQEKAIRNVAEDLFDRLRGHHNEFHRSRKDLAEAFRGEQLDEVRLGELFARHDEVISDARRDIVGALAHIHEVLDERQRRRLARLIEVGSLWRHHGWHGPYRDAACSGEV